MNAEYFSAFACACGKPHRAHLKTALVAPGAAARLGEHVKNLGGTRAFLLADENTYAAAGEAAARSLTEAGVPFTARIYPGRRMEPDEKTVGSAVLHFDERADVLVAVGSGVLNDTGKILAGMKNIPYICLGTAPSMDGYASSTSSVIRDRLKISVNSRCPDAVLADPAVLANAPAELLWAGLGDMLAKYVSLCEWRIGAIVTGEYYCPRVAGAVQTALDACVRAAQGLMQKDETAAAAVMEGLILSGIAADWAGVSRPVSGTEHYFSHIWDMRAAALGTPSSLHGVQCAIGTVLTLRGYERLRDLIKKGVVPDAFRKNRWLGELSDYMGPAGTQMLKNAETCALYDPARQAQRRARILAHLPEIAAEIDTLPASTEIETLLRKIGAPAEPYEIGLPRGETAVCFKATKDIRDKYILSSLAFDLGCLDRLAEETYGD
jgi:glycerol-1-phosphate dehydrogenase [NAD(P)+]